MYIGCFHIDGIQTDSTIPYEKNMNTLFLLAKKLSDFLFIWDILCVHIV